MEQVHFTLKWKCLSTCVIVICVEFYFDSIHGGTMFQNKLVKKTIKQKSVCYPKAWSRTHMHAVTYNIHFSCMAR